MTLACYEDHGADDRGKTYNGRHERDFDMAHPPRRANTTNQRIVFNSAALEVVLNLIRRAQPQSVLRHCFWFLRAICLNRNEVQLVLYESLDTILSTKVTISTETDMCDEEESWENSMGGAIYEVFNKCRETCLRVTANQVQKLLDFVGAGSEEETFRRAKLLNALRAVAKGTRLWPSSLLGAFGG